MRTRTILMGVAVAALGALVAASIAVANDPSPQGQLQEAGDTVELSGTLSTEVDADGDVRYVLDGVELSVGPPWFWGENHPLDPFVGQSVTVTGQHDDGVPSENANENARGGGPSFDVFTVNGEEVRAAGKPPWAGGPKVVGESHPGWAGWQRAQEMSGGRAGGPGSGEDDAE